MARPGDRFYQLSRYSASFYIPSVDLRRSPFERLLLSIIFEVDTDVFARQKAYFVLVHDQDSRNSQIGACASIDSYNIEEVRFISSYHSYGTDWGLYQGDLDDSRLAADRDADRASGSFVGRRAGRCTAGLPSKALLTLLFLQQSYKAELPSLSYLTFLDCLPAYSCIGSLLLFMLFLWGTNVLEKDQR